MSLSEHVSLQITADTVGIARAGFGVALILSCNASFAERVRYYDDLPGLTTDGFATTSPEYLAASALLSQSPHPEKIAIGRALGKPTLAYRLDVVTVTLGATYKVVVEGQGATTTTVSYTTKADLTFTADNTTETFTSTGHGMATGDGPYRVSNSGGALPSGLSVDTDYWVISTGTNTFQLATSKANALAETELLIADDGTGTHTLRRNQNDVICAQLVQGINAVAGKNFTAAQVPGGGETDHVTVTGDAAGNWFSVAVADVALLKNAMTHVEPATTLATDLNAIQLEQPDWYALVTLYNSEAYIKAAAAWVESQKKIYLADTSDSDVVTVASSAGDGDVANDLKNLEYARTSVWYHPSAADMLSAAVLGACLSLEPGEETFKFKTLSGVSPTTTTSTHRTNLRAKNANWYMTVAGRNITMEGTTADGDFIDNQRGLDWLEDDMQKGVFGALTKGKKTSYTDAGVAVIENEVRASLDRAVQKGILAPLATDAVTVPKVSAIASNDKALRRLPDVKFKCTLAGAVHKVVIQGTVSV